MVIVSSGTAGAYAEAAQALVDGLVHADMPRQDILQLTAADMAWRIKAGASATTQCLCRPGR